MSTLDLLAWVAVAVIGWLAAEGITATYKRLARGRKPPAGCRPTPAWPVELRPAYAWICHQCGADNWGESEMIELGSDEDTEIRARWPECEGAQLSRPPDFVMCSECGRQFPTITPGEEIEEDE